MDQALPQPKDKRSNLAIAHAHGNRPQRLLELKRYLLGTRDVTRTSAAKTLLTIPCKFPLMDSLQMRHQRTEEITGIAM